MIVISTRVGGRVFTSGLVVLYKIEKVSTDSVTPSCTIEIFRHCLVSLSAVKVTSRTPPLSGSISVGRKR